MTRRTFLRATAALGAGCLAALCGCESGSPSEDAAASSSSSAPISSSGGAAASSLLQTTFFALDTVCIVEAVAVPDALDGVAQLCAAYEQMLSRTIPESDIGRINAAAGASVEVDSETAALITAALEYCRLSGGLFDITIGAVSELWDFKEGVVPSDEAIAQALPHVGYGCIQVDGSTVTLHDPQAKLDLGGIAKGYIADRLVDYLLDRGASNIMVNLGGNVKVAGGKPDGTPWRVGVRSPHDVADAASIGYFDLMDGSVVTSGLYERQFEKDGRRYWHILDPRTGYPVESAIVSASICSERSIDGDGLTKPLFMMDENAAIAFLEQQGVRGCLIDEHGGIRETSDSGFRMLG